jgi:hypothetical protein
MKKLLLILLCLPMVGFGQDSKKEESKLNFNKSNNYNARYNKTTSKKYYNSPSKFNFNRFVKEHNDSTSTHIFYSKNKTGYSPFNKGLIHLLSKAMQKGVEDNPSILKGPDSNDKTQIK